MYAISENIGLFYLEIIGLLYLAMLIMHGTQLNRDKTIVILV